MEENKIIEQFKNKHGLDLNVYCQNNGFDQDHVLRVYNYQKFVLEVFCKSFNYNFNYNKLSESRKEIFDDLILNQIYWVLNNFDFSTLAGYDFGNNSATQQEEIIKRIVSPIVKEALKAEGFLYRGLW